MFAENLWRRNTSSRFSSARHLFSCMPADQHTPTGQRPRATDLAVCERPVGEAQIDCTTDTRSARTVRTCMPKSGNSISAHDRHAICHHRDAQGVARAAPRPRERRSEEAEGEQEGDSEEVIVRGWSRERPSGAGATV